MPFYRCGKPSQFSKRLQSSYSNPDVRALHFWMAQFPFSVIRNRPASKSQSATETIRPLAITSWPSSTKINTEHLEQVLFSCQDLNCLTYRQRQLDDEQISDYSSTHHLCSQLQNLLLDIGLTLLRIFL